jgi:plasmid stability protein
VAQLIVRNIGEPLVRALRQRAARHGRPAEAEHREILRESLEGEVNGPSFKAFLVSMPDVGSDTDFAAARDLPRRVEG